MSAPNTFAAVVAAWPSRGEFAEDAGAGAEAVKKWVRRDSIPPEYWNRLVEAAERRSIAGITLELLAALAAAKRAEPERPAA